MSAPSTQTLAEHLVATASASPDSAALLAGMMLDRLRYQDQGGPPVVVDAEGRPALDAATGQPKTVGSLLSDYRRELPQLFTSVPVSPVNAAAAHGVVGLTARAAAEHAAREQRGTTGEDSNPYVTGNRTRIVMLEARDPARAARLKAEAGK